MDSRKLILKETAVVAVGQAVCVGFMLGIFALLQAFDRAVLLGGIVGSLCAIGNFFFMALGAMLAADKAVEQDVKGGQATVRSSMLLRLAVTALVLIAFAKSGLCNVLAMVLPLAFTRPVLTFAAFFRKAGGSKA